MMRHHELAAAMRAAGYTVDGLAKAVSVDPKSVGRWLNAGRVPHPRTRARVAEVLKRTPDDLWPDSPRRDPAWFRTWPQIEREARQIRWYEPLCLPGVFQTEAYARALLAGEVLAPGDLDALVAGRLRRQAILTQEHPPRIVAVIDHHAVALLAAWGAQERREQCARLVEIAELPHVSLHVIPPRSGFHPGLGGPFILADLDGGNHMAYADSQLEAEISDRADAVDTLATRRESIRNLALPGPASIETIRGLAND